MINTIETGIGIGLLQLLELESTQPGYSKLVLVLANFSSGLLNLVLVLDKFDILLLVLVLLLKKCNILTSLGFGVVGIGNFIFSTIGIGIDCQLLIFSIPIPVCFIGI